MAIRAAAVLAAAIMIALHPSSARSADFYLIEAKKNQIDFFIDQDAIATEANGMRAAPIVFILRSSETLHESFDYGVAGTQFDCAHRRVAAVSLTAYLADGREAPEQSPKSGETVWVTVDRGSQAEAALEFVCAERGERASHGVSMGGLSLKQIVDRVRGGAGPAP